MAWDDNGRWLGEIQPINHRHVHETPYERTLRIVRSEPSPGWVSYTEMAKFTEDHYDYILARVHDSMAQASCAALGEAMRDIAKAMEEAGLALDGYTVAVHTPPKKKECMFEKENDHEKS